MHFTRLAATIAAVTVGTVHGVPVVPSSGPVPADRFFLKTAVKPSTTDKSAFNNLYVYAYHTGAGTNDAMLSANQSHAVAAHALAGDVPNAGDTAYFNVLFDIGTLSDGSPIPWALQPNPGDSIYADWRPVTIDAGGAGPTNETAFFLTNDGKLAWTNTAGLEIASSFNGWFVCQWWHADIDDTTQPGVQLFFRYNGYAVTTPSSCADVDLVLEYLP